MDLRDTRIANSWIVLFGIFGILLRGAGMISSWFGSHTSSGGRLTEIAGGDLTAILSAVLIPLLLLIPFWLFGMIGAGDIKLLAVLGLYLSYDSMLFCLLYTFLFGAGFAVLSFLLSGNFFRRIHYFCDYMIRYMRTGEIVPYRRPGFREESLHMTVPILMAVLLWIGGVF